MVTVYHKGKVNANSSGKAIITAKLGKKKYNCKLIIRAKNTDSGKIRNKDNSDKLISKENSE